MSRILLSVLGLLIIAGPTNAEPENIPLSRLGKDYQLVGRLHVPLRKVVTLEGVVFMGAFKSCESGPNLRVQKINGRATQEDIQIALRPLMGTWREKPEGVTDLPKLDMGGTYEMEGYETGGYHGIPGEVSKKLSVPSQECGGPGFGEQFEVTAAKRIEPIIYAPAMFEGTHALIQGKAVSREGKAAMIGDGWTVIVIDDKAWPPDIEGKQVETYGMYNPTSDRNVSRLVDGTWRLVSLDDQLGRTVELRGIAWEMDGVWRFDYRGTQLYVENMKDLPGWTSDNYGPMVIRGRLEKANLPRLDQISSKPDRDLKEYFIVRDASWKPLPALLSPERPIKNEE